MPKLIYIIAGEPSGDILASRLMQALWKQHPDIRFVGVGGETMQALGFKSMFPMADISVMGFWEVAPRLPLILKRMKQVMADLEALRPDLLITVDSWGFVSSILKKVKKRKMNIPTLHYVAPQVWAWKKSRAPKAAKLIDRLMTLWPYEPPYFEKYGLRCDFVGHPVVENTAQLPGDLPPFKKQYQIPEDCTLLCLLPGSRQSELKRLIPVFKEVVARLQAQIPNLFVAIPTVDATAGEVAQAFANMPTPHCIIRGQQNRYLAFRACRFAIAASGTVTLELTAFAAPHIIAYRFSRLTNRMVKFFVTAKYANLINILADHPVIPEFVLDNCQAGLIYAKALELMQDSGQAQEQVRQAKQYFTQLKPRDLMPSDKAASVVLEMLHKNGNTIPVCNTPYP
ncbi:MAG: lipid-A-disaccharide synthase [Bacteroidales bacterium]|nr:lipid-A-disaccharide synthase [Bacteroidales bacterium]